MGLGSFLEAGLGAGAGFAIGGPVGGLMGAGLGGGISNALFGGPGDAPTYGDINLQKENPELWKELEELKAATSEYQSALTRRRSGPTPNEMIQKREAEDQIQAGLANRGLVGSSAGTGLMADAEARLSAQIQERAFQEEQQLMAAKTQAQAQYLNSLQGGLHMAMEPRMASYQNDQQEDMAKNQLYSGLFNSGLALYGMNKFYGSNKLGPPSPEFNPYGGSPSSQLDKPFSMPNVGSSYNDSSLVTYDPYQNKSLYYRTGLPNRSYG